MSQIKATIVIVMMTVLTGNVLVHELQAQGDMCQEVKQAIAHAQQQILALKQKIESHQCESPNCEKEKDLIKLKYLFLQQIFDQVSKLCK